MADIMRVPVTGATVRAGTVGHMGEAGRVRPSDAEREAVVERLRTACAEGRIVLAELVERTGTAYAAQSRAELDALLADLPGTEEAATAASPVRGEDSFRVVLGAIKRFGSWVLAPRSTVRVLLGEVKLGLGRARITAEELHMDVRVVLGELKVWVPEGMEVILTGSAFLGQRSAFGSREHRPGMPRLHIHARVILGEVKVFTSRGGSGRDLGPQTH